MLQQHSLKHIVKMFGIFLPNQTKFAILFLSLVLTACGGTSERTTPLAEPSADGVAPSLTIKTNEDGTPYMRDVFAKSVNKCNLGQKVAIDQTVLVQVSASESVLAPDVTIAGMSVAMSGTNYTWSGEFDMSQLPADSFVHGDNIPYEISVTDSSGQTSDPFKPAANEADALEFCDADVDPDKCACYPEDISGVWRLAQKARAMGVGQSEGNTGDWSSTDFHLSQRDCVFDDTYEFVVDPADSSKKKGAFFQEMDGWTWLEPWQSGDVERCGLPQTPFDGSNPEMSYVWDRELGTLTLKGAGAHIALPRVANDEENTGTPVEQVVYKLETANSCFMSFNIKSGGPSPWWHFEIEKADCEDAGASGPVNGAAAAPSIFSTSYDGLGATDLRLDMTATYSSNGNDPLLPQPTVTDTGETLRSQKINSYEVPAILFADLDGDDLEENPGAYAGFLHNSDSEVKLYSYTDAIKGQAYLDAVQADADASAAFAAAEDALDLDPENEDLEAAVVAAATAARTASITLREADYYSNTLTFGGGGYIYFKGWVPSNGEVDVYFKIDHYEVDPLSGEFAVNENGEYSIIDSFSTDVITVKGSDMGFYGFEIEGGKKEGNSIAMVINTPDTAVLIADLRVIKTPALDAKIRGPYFFDQAFSGGPMGDDPATAEVETNAALDADGNLLVGELDTIEITDGDGGISYMVPSIYFEDPDNDGVIENPGAYSGISIDAGGTADLDARALTFGEGGKITFMASVQSGTADVRFRLERIGSEFALETEPSCTMPAATVSGSSLTKYSIEVPRQARRTFKNVVLYIDTPDKVVTITDIMMETSPIDPTISPVDCGSDAALYGDKELDMTAPYGDATIDAATDDQGNAVALFRVDSMVGNGYGGYAVNNGADPSPLVSNPAAFGTGGKITFTASIPALQQVDEVPLDNAQTSVDLRFKFERESSLTPDSCKTEPSFTTEVITISGPEMEYSIDIDPPTANEYGGGSFNTYQNFIMELLTDDTQVQISNIILSTTPPTNGVYIRPESCFASPLPSEYFDNPISASDFDGDGIANGVDLDIDNDGTPNEQDDDPNTTEVEADDEYNYNLGFGNSALFTGTYGGDLGGSDTIQSRDEFTFPADSAYFGGWSNDNASLNPLQFAPRVFFMNPIGPGPARIAFCASAPVPAEDEADIGDVSVTFKFENDPYPDNSQQVLTNAVNIPRDGVIKPYMAFLTDNTNIAVNSFTHSDGTVTPPEFPKPAPLDTLSSPATVTLTREFTSLQMYINKRDVTVTIGKITGNWDNSEDKSFFSKANNLDADDLEASEYCSNFPVPDSDNDGIKDSRDIYPNDPDKASDIDLDNDGIDDLLDGDIDGDGIVNEGDSTPYGN